MVISFFSGDLALLTTKLFARSSTSISLPAFKPRFLAHLLGKLTVSVLGPTRLILRFILLKAEESKASINRFLKHNYVIISNNYT